MGFFGNKNKGVPSITPNVSPQPIAVEINADNATNTAPLQPKEEIGSFEEWENETVNEEQQYPQEQPATIRQPQSLPNATLTEEEEIMQMKEMIARKEEEIKVRKFEEERRKKESQPLPQQQIRPQTIYLTEAELLREINRKLDALVMWAANMSGVEDGKRE